MLIPIAGEEDLPRTGRLAAPSPSSALDKRRAPPAQNEGKALVTLPIAGEEDLPRTGRLAAPSPSSALDKRRAPPAPVVREPWSKCLKHRQAEYKPLAAAWFLQGLFLVAAHASDAAAPAIVIVQPGYPGTTKDAEGFVSSLASHLEEKAALKGLKGEYHNDPKAALEAIAKLKPAFGLVSLGFYLEHREKLGLKPLLQSNPADNFVLVAREGEVKDLKSLEGQQVAGGPLHELEFQDRIVFAGKAKPAGWDSKPVLNASRALRDLIDRKKYSAVLLTGREYRAFAPLYQTKRLEKIAETDYYPPAFLVALSPEPGNPPGAPGNGNDQGDTAVKSAAEKIASDKIAEEGLRAKASEQVKRAFSDLTRDLKGKKILETMGAEGFGEIKSDWLKELEGRYAAQEKK